METVPCNLCGSNEYTPMYRKPDRVYFPSEFFQVVECNNCGLGFVNPRPRVREMGKYYPSQYYHDFSDKHEKHLRRYALEANYLMEFETLTPSPCLLDIGCANGDFPRFMKARGWQVEGVEIFTDPQQILDFPVYRTWFPVIPVHEAKYDAVTAWAVLEHVHDPMSYFQKAAQVLKPGGVFVFLVTNFRSLASRHLFVEDIPRHLYFFTEETVEKYMGKCGLRLEGADHSNKIFDLPPYGWLHYCLARLLKREWRFPPYQQYADFLRERNLKRNLLARLKFILKDPLYYPGLLLTPLLEKWQIARRKYGIITYKARKKGK